MPLTQCCYNATVLIIIIMYSCFRSRGVFVHSSFTQSCLSDSIQFQIIIQHLKIMSLIIIIITIIIIIIIIKLLLPSVVVECY